ncbi:SDR family oxidoreductase [Arsenicicoccus cauae]|uniref:SDR family oxidoreductase n=1 Tax=Arsenicicoccus cauae TaxID=2663847 RepID=UPI00370D3C8A
MTTSTSAPDLSAIPKQKQAWPGSEVDLQPSPDHGESSWVGRDRLTGKRILITGGDSGIGRATAVVAAKEGASVVVTHLPQEAEDARATQAAVQEAGGTCELIEADLRTYDENQRVARAAVSALGGLDVLIANAAYQMTHERIEDFPPEQIERTFATNVFGPFWLVQELAEELRGGSIIITTSVQAYSPSDNLLDYAGTKAALNNMVVNLAGQLGERGIRVNAVAPGPIWTPLIPATMPEEKVEGFGSDTPLGRAGHPVEVAAAYVFLASDEASYVSGTVLGVTGGKPVF